jgi:predicted DNA binding CopG/RHH family protein
MKKTKNKEIKIYDENDTTSFIDKKHPLRLSDLNFKLPPEKPTQVVSIRLPTWLLNKIRSISSNQDIPYQALIKFILAKEIKKSKELY